MDPITQTGRLAGRVIVVTGAGSGLGLSAVERFAAAGAKVIGIDRQPDAAVAAGAVATFVSDVTDAEQSESIARQITRDIGPVDGLATFAGITANGPIHDTAYDAWRRTFDVNVLGTMNWVKAVLPDMRSQRRGSIVLIASQLALAGGRDCISYAASKGAILSLARSLAIDYAADGIRTNSLAPGACDTPMLSASLGSLPPQVAVKLKARHAMGRFGRPEEVANAALYLLSDEASFVTGVTLPVDGGWLAA
jgi:2-keto-3-deoxy-L-fuconate dehydrogenase